jgi:predicted DsbA family dithiol-disulfide isomerase
MLPAMKFLTPLCVSSFLRPRTAGFLLLLLFFVLTGCKQLGLEPRDENAAAAGTPENSQVAAVLAGREITVAEIDEFMKNAFIEEMRSKPASEIFEARSRGLQQMVQEQILDTAAAERGITPDEVPNQIVADVPPPTAEEVSAWYTENQANLGGAQFDQVSARIEDLLLNEKRSQVWSAFMDEKLEALDFEMLFEAPRLELEATRLVRGNADAAVTIMAFSDYQCPYCIRSEPVLAEVLSRYPEQVRVVHRHFPLDSIHPFARPAAEAAMCADEQGKFWAFHDAIFARSGKLSEGSFAEIGSELGLDGDALGTCMSERRYADFVQQDFDAGVAAGVTGTPAFFVNGVSLKGSRNADELSQIVDSELARVSAN